MEDIFKAELTDFKVIHNVLKSITFTEFAIVRALPEGLKITLDEMRCVETTAYVPTNLFASYFVNEGSNVKMKLSLKVFTECLHIFGDEGNPNLKMTYKGHGYPLRMILSHNDDNITIDAEINTLNIDDGDDFTLEGECDLNVLTVDGPPFLGILQSLNVNADDMELVFTPGEICHCTIITTSALGISKMDIPENSEMVKNFKCATEKFVSKYAYSNIKQFMKAMNFANLVKISSGESGLLQIQLSINATRDRQIFVEYYVTAMFEDND